MSHTVIASSEILKNTNYSLPLSFARKFSSNERPLGTRECARNARFVL